MKLNKVYIVGAGPGRKDLITVRGANVLKEADVVIHDYLVNDVLLDNVSMGAEIINCGDLCRGRHGKSPARRQDKVNSLLVKKAKSGKKVVRLKSGDPSIFARCADECEALSREKIAFEVIPGVTAASAAASSGKIPLTDRRITSSCVFVTGYESRVNGNSLIDWSDLAGKGTLVFYMGVSNIGGIAARLISAGKAKDTPRLIVQNASLASEKLVTGRLEDMKSLARDNGITAPAVLIIGDVAGKGVEGPNGRRRVLFTGLSEERFFLEDSFYHLPLIKIIPLDDYTVFDGYLRDIENFDWIVFTSRYGVEYFFKRLEAVRKDARDLKGVEIAVIGMSTARRLKNFGVSADLIPREESSEGLIKKLSRTGLDGKKVFMPRSDLSDKGLEKALRKMGAEVTACVAYRNVAADWLPDLDMGSFDEIMFTSPSTVRSFKARYKTLPDNVKVKCIGEVTLREARRCRFIDQGD